MYQWLSCACLFNICLTGKVTVKGEEKGLQFGGTRAAPAKAIRLGLEEGEPVAVMVSKVLIVCGYLLKHVFAILTAIICRNNSTCKMLTFIFIKDVIFDAPKADISFLTGPANINRFETSTAKGNHKKDEIQAHQRARYSNCGDNVKELPKDNMSLVDDAMCVEHPKGDKKRKRRSGSSSNNFFLIFIDTNRSRCSCLFILTRNVD